MFLYVYLIHDCCNYNFNVYLTELFDEYTYLEYCHQKLFKYIHIARQLAPRIKWCSSCLKLVVNESNLKFIDIIKYFISSFRSWSFIYLTQPLS